jgi:pimeloyl-ACP methyl ester carboxylesterase
MTLPVVRLRVMTLPPEPRLFAGSRSPRLWTAIGVALAAVGCAPAGPNASIGPHDTMREAQVAQINGPVMISYLRSGRATGPRLILVHGTPGAADGWSDYLLDPPPGFEVVALDRPGFGATLGSQPMPSLSDQAKAVRALFPADGRPVVLLGHSLGGPIVAQVAIDEPTRVLGVIFLAASLDPALEVIHPLQRVGAWPVVRAMVPRTLRNANAELLALKPELEKLAARLGEVRAKVLIMHGTKDDLVPFANVAFMQARLSHAACVETRVLEGRNHFLPWNSQAQVREAIQQMAALTC